MADSDYSVIKPVESLSTIQGLEPTKPRQERKRQPQPGRHHEEPEAEPEEVSESEARRDEDDPHSIDYCA